MTATASQLGFPSSSRYTIITKIASGGMATVYVGALRGSAGFERVVAIKRAHPHLLEEPSCRAMLLEEARLASKFDHPNVIGIRDVEEVDGELLLVMDYVEGASLAKLLYHADSRLPSAVAIRVILDACAGLSAVHEMTSGLVHRDVSPQNILVGVDGVSRISDFGIAKSSDSPWSQATRTGGRRGKPGYMAPEYVESGVASPLGDVFGAGIVAWEALTSRRLFRGATDGKTLELVRRAPITPPSTFAPDVSPELDAVILRATERDPSKRYQSVSAFAEALESVASRDKLIASRREVQRHVNARTSMELDTRRGAVQAALSSNVSLIAKRTEEARADELARPANDHRESQRISLLPRLTKDGAKEEETTRKVSLEELRRRAIGELIGDAPVESGGPAGSGSAPRPKRAPTNARALLSAPPRTPVARATRWLAIAGCALVLGAGSVTAVFGHHAALAGTSPVSNLDDGRALPPVDPDLHATARLVTETATAAATSAVKPVVLRTEVRVQAPPQTPTDSEALASLGDARRAAGDTAGAETFYTKAIDVNPRFLPARIALGDIRWDGGHRAEAADTYRAIVEQFAPALVPQRARDRAARASGQGSL